MIGAPGRRKPAATSVALSATARSPSTSMSPPAFCLRSAWPCLPSSRIWTLRLGNRPGIRPTAF